MLRQPRWAGFALLTILFCVLFVFLGRWQWHRHEDRRVRNMQYQSATKAPPVPLASLVSPKDPFDLTDQYRVVTVTGTYDGAHQLLLRNPHGRSGYDVITPLVSSDGNALLVDRGWVAPSATQTSTPASDVTPPIGTVDATVRLRVSDDPDQRVAPPGQTYVVDVSQIASALPYPLYPAFGDLVKQSPAPDPALELPDNAAPGLGPHLLYAIQWWMFIGIAIVGFVVLLRRESELGTSAPDDRVLDGQSS